MAAGCTGELAQAFQSETGRTPPSPMETHAGYHIGKSAGRLTSKGTITPEKPGKGYARRGGSGVRRGLTIHTPILADLYKPRPVFEYVGCTAVTTGDDAAGGKFDSIIE
jgi:hypothetical protein